MLELIEVRVAYGGIEVVHGVDLGVGAGEAVGMIGPNGAGKSSIFNLIAGTVPAALSVTRTRIHHLIPYARG